MEAETKVRPLKGKAAVTSGCRKELFSVRCQNLGDLITEMRDCGDIPEEYREFMHDLKLRLALGSQKYCQTKES